MTRGISLNRFTLIQPFTTDLTVVSGDAYNIFANPPFNGVSPFPRPTGANVKTADFVPTANETIWSLPFKTQSDYQWSLSLQQALGAGTVLELNYVGSSSVNLFSTVESNYATYIPGQSTIANTQARRLYPQFGQINNTLSAFSANYNAMQVVVNRRYAKGFSVLGSYTWSKALGVNVASGEGSNGHATHTTIKPTMGRSAGTGRTTSSYPRFGMCRWAAPALRNGSNTPSAAGN
jgi:hypothetical protein